ncbi:C2H2-type zinc finger protein [Streptomyces sp. OE57]|uniref:C2H2-type zinc finger protein n=1 Tax=Streptomyces lacaronensis TaxID=3379885 RepID=UPI0039B777BD
MNELIRIQPARHLRVAFARWAVAQRPKVGTVSESAFGVPPRLFTDMPEDLLRGSVVDGHPYVPVDDEPSTPAPVGAPELLGVATVDGLRDAAPGQPLPEVPPAEYGPDSVPLPPPDFAPLEDAPTYEAGELLVIGEASPETVVPLGDTGEDGLAQGEVTDGVTPGVTSEDTRGDSGDTGGESDSSDSPTKPFPCPHCPRSFDSSRGLEVHLRRAHPEV